MVEYTVDCSAVTLAVLLPLTPLPTRSASTSTTRRPARLSSSAVVTPVMPPPTTATSAVVSPVRAGNRPCGIESDHREWRAVVVASVML